MDDTTTSYQPAGGLKFSDGFPERTPSLLIWVSDDHQNTLQRKANTPDDSETGQHPQWRDDRVMPSSIRPSKWDTSKPKADRHPRAAQMITLGYYIPKAHLPERHNFTPERTITKLDAGKCFRVALPLHTEPKQRPTTRSSRKSKEKEPSSGKTHPAVLVGIEASDAAPICYNVPKGRTHIFFFPEWLQGVNMRNKPDAIAENAIKNARAAGHLALTGGVPKPISGGKDNDNNSKSGASDRASAILPTNKDVARRQLDQMMNAIMSAQTQEEKQNAKTKLANWLRRTGEDNPLFESNRYICKLLLAKEVISIEHAELALHEMKTLWPEAFNVPNATIFTAEFIQQLSTLLVSSRDEMSIHYGQLGNVLCLLTVISPEDDKPTGQKLRLVMDTLRRQGASSGYPTTSHTQSNLKSLTSTQLVQHINLKIDIMVDTFKRVMARLTSRAAAANNGTTAMPPAPDFNVLAKLADTIGYDEAARIAEEAYSLLVALMGDVYSAVFEDSLKEIKTFGETFLNQHADDDKADGRENDKTNDRTNSALFVNDDIYNP